MKLNKVTVLLSLLATTFIASASIKDDVPAAVFKVLSENYPLEQLENSGQINFESKFKIDGEFYVLSLGDSVLAISDKGDYVLGGDVVNLQEKVNYIDQAKDSSRKRTIEAITPDQYVSYPSTNKEQKGHIYVYSDITCGFCVKLHKEFPTLTDAGYEVRVVPFVRAVGSQGYENLAVYKNTVAMMSVQDPNERRRLHDDLILGNAVNHDHNNTNGIDAVSKGIDTGVAVGLQGTPHIVLQNGKSISGYMPASQLLSIIAQ